MANKSGSNKITVEQAENLINLSEEYRQQLSKGAKYISKEELEKPLIEKPYRFLDNLSPFIAVKVKVPIRNNPEDQVTWLEFPIPQNVINIKEFEIINNGAEAKITTFDPDYVFLEEFALKILNYKQRGYSIELEVEYGWAVPDSIKRAYPKVEFTDIINIERPNIDITDTKNGLTGNIQGPIKIIPAIATNYSPAAALGIGSVANYFLIYDFLCIDADDKFKLIWQLKDAKQRESFIVNILDFFQNFSLENSKDKLTPTSVNKSRDLLKLKFNISDIAKKDKLNTVRGSRQFKELKKVFNDIIDSPNFPNTPYDILKFIRDNKAVNAQFEELFTGIDLVLENYRIHPYRIYKFLVEVFEKDVLGKDELKNIESINFFDYDIINWETFAGNMDIIPPNSSLFKNIKTRKYLQAIHLFHTSSYPGNLGKDYRELVRLLYKKVVTNKRGRSAKAYGQYFFPKKEYSLSTDSRFEDLIPSVATKCRKIDNTLKNGEDASNYSCQFFRAAPLSAFNNLNVFELIIDKGLKKIDKESEFFKSLKEKIKTARTNIQAILDSGKRDISNSSVIFCIFAPNQVSAIIKDENKFSNNILTTYAYRMRTLKEENYFNSGSKKFIQNNFPDVLSFEYNVQGGDKPGARDSMLVNYVVAGSDYKLIKSLDNNEIKTIDSIIQAAKNAKMIKEQIDKLEATIDKNVDISKINNLKQQFFKLMYGNKLERDGGVATKAIESTKELNIDEFGIVAVLRRGIFQKLLKDKEREKVITNIIPGSEFKSVQESLSKENSISKKIAEEEKKVSKLKISKAKKIQKVEDAKYELATSDYAQIEKFVEQYKKLTKTDMFDVKYNIRFDDPTIFGAGSSSSTEGIASHKQMENLRRRMALDSNSIEVTLTVLGNPSLKKHYVQGPASIFLNVYNPDGSLSNLTGEYSLSSLESQKITAGAYICVLKLLKNQVNNGIIYDYIENNDILPIC